MVCSLSDSPPSATAWLPPTPQAGPPYCGHCRYKNLNHSSAENPELSKIHSLFKFMSGWPCVADRMLKSKNYLLSLMPEVCQNIALRAAPLNSVILVPNLTRNEAQSARADRRRLRSFFLLYLCYVFRALINSPVCWFILVPNRFIQLLLLFLFIWFVNPLLFQLKITYVVNGESGCS